MLESLFSKVAVRKETPFCKKTFKSRLFKTYLNKEKKKSRAQFCLSLGWLHISEKKL